MLKKIIKRQKKNKQTNKGRNLDFAPNRAKLCNKFLFSQNHIRCVHFFGYPLTKFLQTSSEIYAILERVYNLKRILCFVTYTSLGTYRLEVQ